MRRFALVALVMLLGAGSSSSPLLVATRHQLVYVDGAVRRIASAGPGTTGYRLIGAVSDGSVLASFDDAGFADVEVVSPSLESRTIKTFPRGAGGFIGPSSDGFLAYDAGTQLLRRYDLHGSIVGSPAAPIGAHAALGIGDAIVVLAPGKIEAFDARGRLRRAVPGDGAELAPLPGGRVAVSVPSQREVRIYTTALDQVDVVRSPGVPVGTLATGPDDAVGFIGGTPTCRGVSDAEVDLFDLSTAAAARLPVRIRAGIPNPVGLTITRDAVYVANAGCLGNDGSIAVFNRDGTPRGTIVNVGSPTGMLPLAAGSASRS
jgi:hypothetical protein